MAEGIVGRIAALGITALRACTVDVHQLVVAAGRELHPPFGLAERDIDGVVAKLFRRPIQVRGAGPERWVVSVATVVDDRGDIEDRIDRRRTGGVGRAGVVDDALKLLGIG